MPNFISVIMDSEKAPGESTPRKFTPAPMIAVGSLTEAEAQEFAELIKTTFLSHWKTKRAQYEGNENSQ